jgi:hypothetical protein
MTPSPRLTSASPPSIRVQECRGGGFVVFFGAEMYAACSGPHEVAAAMAEIQAMRDDAATPPAGGLPVPARSGADPVPVGIRPQRAPDAPSSMTGTRHVDVVGLAPIGERLRATAGLALMVLLVAASGIVGA